MQQQKQLKVLLIGDSCTDEYVYGVCERLNPEAPVPILKYDRVETQKGMALNVKENLSAFGIEVTMITQDEPIVKRRYIDQRYNQQILRVDTEDYVEPLNVDLPQEHFDALVISDYDKGFITLERMFELVEWFDGPVFIDSKKTILPLENAYIKINSDEYSKLEVKSDNLIVTKGSGGADYQGKNYPGIGVGVFDVVGAGDTFLSALVYFYLLCGKIEGAIPYANKAAAIAVTHFGTYVLKGRDINEICN
jgi:D-beta-D-heptose 7-phosphate kinase/D-beta-D-heptose 1-phosphate adenosyltransferase|tara:strand:- start:974 stop:1723 length:750 start_codon:yes stop_codon:yes gene_type:complete